MKTCKGDWIKVGMAIFTNHQFEFEQLQLIVDICFHGQSVPEMPVTLWMVQIEIIVL